MSLLSGQPVPLHCFGVVLWHALAVGIHDAEVELRYGVSLLGGDATELDSYDRLDFAGHAPEPDVDLHDFVSLLGGQPVPLGRFSVVLRHTIADTIHIAKVELRWGVSLLGGQPVPLHCFSVVL